MRLTTTITMRLDPLEELTFEFETEENQISFEQAYIYSDKSLLSIVRLGKKYAIRNI